MMFSCRPRSSRLAWPSLAAACLLLAAVPVRAQTPTPTPPKPPAPPDTSSEPVHVTGSNLPPFLKSGAVYILNGNEEDAVRVLELSNTGWMRVQSKVGESWVNVLNLTTITPVSKEAAARSETQQKADFIRDGAQAISDAIDAYAAKNNLPPNASFKWQDIRKFLKSGTTIYESGGKDVIGRPYIFGAKVEDHVKVNPETVKELSPMIEDPDDYWGKFKPQP